MSCHLLDLRRPSTRASNTSSLYHYNEVDKFSTKKKGPTSSIRNDPLQNNNTRRTRRMNLLYLLLPWGNICRHLKQTKSIYTIVLDLLNLYVNCNECDFLVIRSPERNVSLNSYFSPGRRRVCRECECGGKVIFSSLDRAIGHVERDFEADDRNFYLTHLTASSAFKTPRDPESSDVNW